MKTDFRNQTEIISSLEFRILTYNQIETLHYQYFPDQKLSVFTFKGFTPPEELPTIYKYIGKFMAENQHVVYKNLTDAQAAEGSFDEASEWLVDKFLPISYDLGLRYAAVVHSPEFYWNLAAEERQEMVTQLAQKLGYQHLFFKSKEEALVWLNSQV